MPAAVVDFSTGFRKGEAQKAFEEQLKALSGKLVIAFFYALWCRPCRNMLQMPKCLPFVIKEADERVVICKIDVDDQKAGIEGNTDIAGKYGIRAIPSIIFFKDIGCVHFITGAVDGGIILRDIKKYL